MTETPSLRLHRVAAVTALRSSTRLPGDSADRIGSSTAPKPGEGLTQPETPYAVVYGLPSITHGPAGDPDADLDYIAQATCVGASDDEADGMADAVAAAWADPGAWSVPGRVADQPLIELIRPATPDPGDPAPRRWSAQVIVRVHTSPA